MTASPAITSMVVSVESFGQTVPPDRTGSPLHGAQRIRHPVRRRSRRKCLHSPTVPR